MRIAHVVDGYHADLLYQEGYLAREQLRRGHDVVVYTRHIHGGNPHEPTRVVQGQLPALAFRLARSMRREQPDVIHVHNVVSQISVAACIVKPLLRCPLVLDSHHSSINTRTNTPFRRAGAAAFRTTVGRFVWRAADRGFAVAGPERSFTAGLLGCNEDEIALIPLGVDTDVFHPSPGDRRATRLRLGVETDFVVVHAGRLVPDKRLDVLLDATGRIGATALLVGSLDERLRPAVERARASGTRIELLGNLPKEDLASALRAADVGVWVGLPSISVIEAMAVGLPLVTQDSPHFRELLGVDRRLVAATVDDLASALIDLRTNPAFAAEVGSRNAARAATRAWPSVADRVEHLYGEAIAAARRTRLAY